MFDHVKISKEQEQTRSHGRGRQQGVRGRIEGVVGEAKEARVACAWCG